MTVQEQFEGAAHRLHKATDNLCRAIGVEAAAPTQAEIDNLVTAIDACTKTAGTLAMPPAAKATNAPAAKRTRKG